MLFDPFWRRQRKNTFAKCRLNLNIPFEPIESEAMSTKLWTKLWRTVGITDHSRSALTRGPVLVSPLPIRHHGKPCAPLLVQKELPISRRVIGISKIGVGGAISFEGGSTTVLPPLVYFRSKRFFVFCRFFAQKWDRPEPGGLDVRFTANQPVRLKADQPSDPKSPH